MPFLMGFSPLALLWLLSISTASLDIPAGLGQGALLDPQALGSPLVQAGSHLSPRGFWEEKQCWGSRGSSRALY